jgi:hypothetical protein
LLKTKAQNFYEKHYYLCSVFKQSRIKSWQINKSFISNFFSPNLFQDCIKKWLTKERMTCPICRFVWILQFGSVMDYLCYAIRDVKMGILLVWVLKIVKIFWKVSCEVMVARIQIVIILHYRKNIFNEKLKMCG